MKNFFIFKEACFERDLRAMFLQKDVLILESYLAVLAFSQVWTGKA